MNIGQFKSHWYRARNSAVFLGMFAVIAKKGAGLILLPVLLHKLDTNDFAFWLTLSAFGGFQDLGDFGFGTTIARAYSYLWAGAHDVEAVGLGRTSDTAQPNLVRIRELTVTVRYFYWLLSILATILVAAIGSFVLQTRMTAVSNPHYTWAAWLIQIILVGYGLGTSRWVLLCQGLGRTKELQAADLWCGLTNIGLSLILLLSGWKVYGLLAGSFARSVLLRFICRRTYRSVVPHGPGDESKPNWELIKRLWPNSWKLGLLAFASYLVSQGSILICSQIKDSSITSNFGLTAQIGGYLINFSAMWLLVKWPQIAMLRQQGRLREMSVLFARRLGLTMATFLATTVVVILAGNRVLAWKGSSAHLLPPTMLILYFLYLTQRIFYIQFSALAYTENVVPFFTVGLVNGVGMFILNYFMTAHFGLWGTIWAPLIADTVCLNWYCVRRGYRGQPLSVRELWRAAVAWPAALSRKTA